MIRRGKSFFTLSPVDLSSSIKMAWNDLVVMVTAHIPSWLILNRKSIGVSITL